MALIAVIRAKRRKPRTDEQIIRALISEVARKASDKDVGGIMEHVSAGYRGEAGDKDELQRYLTGFILLSKWVTALDTAVTVEVRANTAKVSLIVILASIEVRDAAAITPDLLAGSHAIDAELAKEAGTWRIVTASRRDATPSWPR